MSFKAHSPAEEFIGQWFDSLDELVSINKTLHAYLKETLTIEIKKEKMCEKKVELIQELLTATTHTDLLISGLKNACMSFPSFAKYAAMHVDSCNSLLSLSRNAELN